MRTSRQSPRRCADDLLDRRRATRRPASSASPCSRGPSTPARSCPWGAPGVGRRCDAVVHRDLVRAPRPRAAARRARRPQEALAELVAADDDSAYRQVAILDARGAGRRARRRELHPGGRLHSRRRLQRAGEHGRERARLGVDGGGVRGLRGTARRAAPVGARRGRGGGRRLARPPGRRHRGRPARRASRGQREVDLRVDDHADPLGELRRLLRLRGAYNAMRGPPGPSADDVEVLP